MIDANVGIFGKPGDPQVKTVAAQLVQLGARPSIVDTAAGALHHWRITDDAILTPEGPIDWCGLYVRALAVTPPRHHADTVALDQRARWLREAERGRLRHARAKAMHAAVVASGARVVNPVEGYTLHRSKPATDLRIRAAGLRSPRFVITDDVSDVIGFMDDVGEVVTKPLAGGGTCTAVADLARSAEARRRLQADLRLAPGLFQERIRGDDLRLYVLDGMVIGAVHIDTAALDYRGNERSVRPIVVDDELRAAAVRATAACGLIFAGLDIKRTATGELVVLDVNPSPMFAAVERRAGVPVSVALARHLAGAAPPAGRRRPAASPGTGRPRPAISPAHRQRRGGDGSGCVVIVSEGADDDVAAIARAVRRHGLRARVVDLDHERLQLRAPADGAVVLGANGAIPTPRLVCNRVGASGFGLASAAALARQPTDEWPTAHLAAREEQAVVLAAFEQWERSGATVLDPVRRVDRTMQRPLLRAQLQALGFSVGPVTEELRRTSVAGRLVLLDGEVVVAALGRRSQWKAVAVTPETADTMRHVAGVLQVRLASVDIRHRTGHPLHITAWAARPRLAALGAATGVDVWSDVLTRLTAVSADPPTSFVTPDLVRNFSAV